MNEIRLVAPIIHGEYERPFAIPLAICLFGLVLGLPLLIVITSLFPLPLLHPLSIVVYTIIAFVTIGLFVFEILDDRAKWITYELDSNGNKINKMHHDKLPF